MKIKQIPSNTTILGHKGQWYCSDSIMGSDGDPINRYLQKNGTWGKTTDYFNSRQAIEKVLVFGFMPDFSITSQELQDRATIREAYWGHEGKEWKSEFDMYDDY